MHYFNRYSHILLPLIICLFVLFFISGIYTAFYASPPDYKQGEIVRIMYIHVPAAWISLGAYLLIALLSFLVLIWRNVTASILSHAIAPIGMCFSFICLVTGSIWGKGTWGTWWVWDARLTSMLVLFFLYIGYLALWNFFDNEYRSSRSTAIFTIFSAINIPIIKFSVNIWNTLHQPASILRKNGIAIDISMMIPLLLMFTALSLLFIILLIIRTYTLINIQKINIKLSQIANEDL
ncbi:cytochrome c biogenesis protein CcsA [Neoehrlichia mikurensis]|uniref:Heme exporter protein C n=1 Tax=Neoehrlichia mikurensis TaxID=89586 RepID=A0A9Q9BZW6_9RICK|nr:heme ABC transporter permease CcmC [Neoehrlichia mikurensis]QXK91730.1 cytochrome c biogenesis protein CcsA [Neoehrlichia mikurensis]QXK92942.1 cytochrome c biogenesis protein CcsA [Neoehrlichia mikurensis]QXK93420.1 cytochrome c biogenesis protein CcsA [Neoehrlichia mikurensis]UTO55629.1 heme ABC transporter permease CcmC [Neoehrlichia mikurensis]UTO56550.1 heme ABC transporter permease CcmC [Neoehrlichia mikurensis]